MHVKLERGVWNRGGSIQGGRGMGRRREDQEKQVRCGNNTELNLFLKIKIHK